MINRGLLYCRKEALPSPSFKPQPTSTIRTSSTVPSDMVQDCESLTGRSPASETSRSPASETLSVRTVPFAFSPKNRNGTSPRSSAVIDRRLRYWAYFCCLVAVLIVLQHRWLYRDAMPPLPTVHVSRTVAEQAVPSVKLPAMVPPIRGNPATYALPLQPNDFIPINNASCHGVQVPGSVPKPQVSESVFYMTARFRVGGRRWDNDLRNLGCRVLMSSAVPENNIFVFRDEFPSSLLHHPRYELHRQFLRNETDASGRGAGYWFWKPVVVLSVLQKDGVLFGSYIIYTDGDRPDVIGYASDVVETMEQRSHDFTIQQWKGGTEIVHTKGDIFEHFGVHGRWNKNNKPQYSANFFVVKKSPTTIEFFSKWASLMEDYHLVSDEPSRLANHPAFAENRHDQSMLSMLLKFVYRDGGPTKTAVEIDMNNSYVEPLKKYVSCLSTFSLSLEQSRPNELQP